jgi:hypothetical protein
MPLVFIRSLAGSIDLHIGYWKFRAEETKTDITLEAGLQIYPVKEYMYLISDCFADRIGA